MSKDQAGRVGAGMTMPERIWATNWWTRRWNGAPLAGESGTAYDRHDITAALAAALRVQWQAAHDERCAALDGGVCSSPSGCQWPMPTELAGWEAGQ